MKQCNLKILAKYPFKETEAQTTTPVIPILIHREGMRRSIDTYALLDTGYDKGLLLSREIRDLLYIMGDPDREDSLGAGNIEIPTEVFVINVKILDNWYRLEGFAPKEEGFETILGRELLDLWNVCIRGPGGEVALAVQ